MRDYFVKQWERFKDYPWGVLAHSTHLRGDGIYDAESGVDTYRVFRNGVVIDTTAYVDKVLEAYATQVSQHALFRTTREEFLAQAEQHLDDLNNRVLETEIFESFQLTEESGLVNRTFALDGVITPDFLLAQVPDDIDVDVTQVIDVRVIVTLPGEIVETSGTRGPRESGTVWWRVTSGAPIPLHAVSEMRDSENVTLLAAGGAALLVVTAIALALVGFGVYRRRQRREEP